MALDIPGFDEFVEIGRGGFGVVHRATQSALGRTVAIKVLAVGDLDPDTLRRFEREARILGRLSDHPNIVTVHDTGTTPDGRPWVAMAYLPSGSLADRLRTSGPLPADEVASIGVRVAGALETAHRAGILHRDVKPENILVTTYGEPALADFGIARMAGGTQTVAGTVTASLAHAPPEVLEGSAPAPAGDVYGLASTLYALLNGRPAFDTGPDGAVSQMIAGIVSRPVPDLRPLGVPEPLADALEQGLARDLDERPATAAAFAEVLRRAQRDAGWPLTKAVVLDPGEESPAPPTDRAADGGAGVTEDATRIHAVTGGGSRSGDTGTSPAPATPIEEEPSRSKTAGREQARRGDGPGSEAPDGSGGPSRRGLVMGLAAGAVVIAAVIGVVALGGSGDSDPGAGPAGTSSEAGGPSGIAMTPIFAEGENAGEGRVLFRQQLESTPLGINSDGESVYIATENAIEARAPETGLLRWTFQRSSPGSEPMRPWPLREGGIAFADGDELVLLHQGSGELTARVKLDGAPTEPVVTRQGVLLAVAGATIARIDGSGAEVWRAGKPLAAGEQYGFHGHDEDMPVLVSTDFELFALDPDTGEELWSVGTDGPDELDVAQGNGLVVAALVTDGQLTLRAWSIDSGEGAWDVSRGAVDQDAVRVFLHDGMLVLADGEHVTGLDSNSGSPDWQIDLPTGGDLDVLVDTGRVWTVADIDGAPQASVHSVYSGDVACGPTDVGSFPEWPAQAGSRWLWTDTEGSILAVEAPDGSDESPFGGDCTLAWLYDLPEDANAVAPLELVAIGNAYVIDDNQWFTGLRLWDQ